MSDAESWTRRVLEAEARKRGIRNPEARSRLELARLILAHDYTSTRSTRRMIGKLIGEAAAKLPGIGAARERSPAEERRRQAARAYERRTSPTGAEAARGAAAADSGEVVAGSGALGGKPEPAEGSAGTLPVGWSAAEQVSAPAGSDAAPQIAPARPVPVGSTAAPQVAAGPVATPEDALTWRLGYAPRLDQPLAMASLEPTLAAHRDPALAPPIAALPALEPTPLEATPALPVLDPTLVPPPFEPTLAPPPLDATLPPPALDAASVPPASLGAAPTTQRKRAQPPPPLGRTQPPPPPPLGHTQPPPPLGHAQPPSPVGHTQPRPPLGHTPATTLEPTPPPAHGPSLAAPTLEPPPLEPTLPPPLFVPTLEPPPLEPTWPPPPLAAADSELQPSAADESRLSHARREARALHLRWQVSEQGAERARVLLGMRGELALRIVSVRADDAYVVHSEVTEHGPIELSGEWTAQLASDDAHCVAAVGLRSAGRFVSIVHRSSAPQPAGSLER